VLGLLIPSTVPVPPFSALSSPRSVVPSGVCLPPADATFLRKGEGTRRRSSASILHTRQRGTAKKAAPTSAGGSKKGAAA
jgi:hypothetical protein